MNAKLDELDELFDANSQFLYTQPAVRSVFKKLVVLAREQDKRIRELEKRFEDTEG